MTQDPISVIGQNAFDDWQLRPKVHASELPAEAGALKRVLERDDIQRIVDDFTVADARAVSAQRWYKFWGRLGIYAVALATIIGTTMVLRLDQKFGIEIKYLALILQYSFLALAFIISQWLILKSPFQTWMKNRGKAEILRIDLFDKVSQANEPSQDGELALLPLQLEYFRRYQLDVQLSYYKKRGGEHMKASGHTSRAKILNFIFILLWVGIAGFAGLFYADQNSVIQLPTWLKAFPLTDLEPFVMAAGIIVASIHTARMAKSLMNLDERNAARYEITSANLDTLSAIDLPNARAAAKVGDRQAVFNFIEKVQSQISSEHQEWVLIREHAPNAADILVQTGAPTRVEHKKV